MSSYDKKKRIVILGGGAGALSAAFGLTDKCGWQDEYEITLYQLGWRLGGKGASGRNLEEHNRIEEHGLHVWGGSYDNAFWMIRKCYSELARKPGSNLATWQDAFKPHSFITNEEYINGQWLPWNIEVPTRPGLPGDDGPIPTLWDCWLFTVDFIVEKINSSDHPDLQSAGKKPSVHPDHPGWIKALFHAGGGGVSEQSEEEPDRNQMLTWFNSIASFLKRDTDELVALGVGLLSSASKLAHSLDKDARKHSATHHRALIWLLDEAMKLLYHAIGDKLDTDTRLRRLWIHIDLSYAQLRGALEDEVLQRGFGAINDYEWTEWLRKNKAKEITLDSALNRGIYDYMFGFVSGNITKPGIEAGSCLHIMVRQAWTYRGAIFWKMQAGMGDTVFTPLYQVLKQRGVKFKFFHRVDKLVPSKDGTKLEAIKIGRQVRLKAQAEDPEAEYYPLIKINGLDCWPATPLYDQIVEGEELKADHINLESVWTTWKDSEGELILNAGQEFDLVVLGISLGALKQICSEMIKANQDWENLIANVQTVQTQSIQLWLKPDAAGLGWQYPSTILTAYREPLDTWGDMSQLIPQESWPANVPPKSIAYFCGPMEDAPVIPPHTDKEFPEIERARVQHKALELLNGIAPLWPGATKNGETEFNWEMLEAPDGATGEQRLKAQYFRANIDPSERYVLTVPGSSRYRLPAGDSKFDNLFLAGDWVFTPINAGCIEAAVMAGLYASRAICGYPEEIRGEMGWDERE